MYGISAYLMPHPPLLIPEIGKGKEVLVNETRQSMIKVSKEISEINPETIIVISPHGPVFSDAITISSNESLTGNFSKFGSPEVKMDFTNDVNLMRKIVFKAGEEDITVAKIDEFLCSQFDVNSSLDHGFLVPMYYVDQHIKNYKVIHITYGLLSHEKLYKFGMLLRKTIEEAKRKVVVIASGDLSHKLKKTGPYGYSKAGEVFDEKIISFLENRAVVDVLNIDDQLSDQAAECGRRSIDILLGFLDGYKYNVTKHSYEGLFGVGYGVLSFNQLLLNNQYKYYDSIKKLVHEKIIKKRNQEDSYVKIARAAIYKYVTSGKRVSIADNMPKEMINDRAGVFVSIKKRGNLRGCIGTITPYQKNIAEEIIENAISACSKDYRFPRVETDELTELEISVDVLSKLDQVSDIIELNPKKYGVLIEHGNKRGVLLPNLSGINSVQEQLKIAKSKAGIKDSDPCDVYKFTVERHE